MALQTCQNEYTCLCWSCHIDRLSEFDGQQPIQLLMRSSISQNREAACRKEAFTQVLKQIATHKAYKREMYATYKYVNTAPFLKTREGGAYEAGEARKMAMRINQDAIVYDNFHKVLWNIQDCRHIDITLLTANQLYKALDPKWCFKYEVLMQGRGNRPAEEQYDEADFQDLLEVIKNHPAYTAIDKSKDNNYGKREVTALLMRAQTELLKPPK